MLKFNLALFLSTAAMLFFILRYRIHVHIEYTPRHSRRRGPQSGSTANRLPSADRGGTRRSAHGAPQSGSTITPPSVYSGSSSAGISRRRGLRANFLGRNVHP